MEQAKYRRRREAFMRGMQEGIAIVRAGHEMTRINDTHYPFRQDNSFAYLTGFPEPDAIAVFLPRAEQRFVLFVRPRDPVKEIWDGRRYGVERAKEVFGADAVYSITEIEEKLPKLMENTTQIYYAFGASEDFDTLIRKALMAARARARHGVLTPTRMIDPGEVLFDQRLIKDAEEIELMRRAAQITVAAHRHGMQVTKPGMNEAELQAEMEYTARKQGSRAQGYTSIVAGGDNANILHYVENCMELQAGELVLVDLGCEFDFYTADITRTWPVNGKFSPEQKTIYDIVLKAQEAAFRVAKPGATIRALHEASCLSLAQSLVDIGVLKGSPETHMRVCIGDDTSTKFDSAEPVLRDFYMHGTSHWLGMDVHDCGWVRRGKEWRELQPGMCLTVEPGLYFARDGAKTPKRFRGIGVRIEDDIHITPSGMDILTQGLPRTTEQVEAVCAGKG